MLGYLQVSTRAEDDGSAITLVQASGGTLFEMANFAAAALIFLESRPLDRQTHTHPH